MIRPSAVEVVTVALIVLPLMLFIASAPRRWRPGPYRRALDTLGRIQPPPAPPDEAPAGPSCAIWQERVER